MATIDYAMIGVAGLAAASTVLDISNTTSERQPQAQWRPDASYISKKSTYINFDEFEKYDSPDPDNQNSVNSPLIGRTTDYTHWSILKIDGVEVPGIAKVTVNFSKDLDKTKLDNYDWSTILDKGANSKQISINIKMNAYDYDIYKKDIQHLLVVKSFGNTSALGYYSPSGDSSKIPVIRDPALASLVGGFGVVPDKRENTNISNRQENIVYLENALLADYGIDRAVLESMSQSTPELGMTEIQLEFVEYHEKQKRPARPSPAAKGSVKQSDSEILPNGKNGYGK